jgi:hypothetical protein
VDLALDVEKALARLSDDERQEAMEFIASALVDFKSWPAPGGWDWTLRSGPRLWIVFTAYLGGVWIVSLGASDDRSGRSKSGPATPLN